MERRRFLRTTGGAVAAVATMRHHVTAFGRPTRIRAGDIDEFIRHKMERDHIPGVAAAIVDRDGLVWESGYGWADIEARVPMTIDALQNIASISKTVTATAIMQVRDAGLLDLDRDVSDYLPFAVRNPAHPGVPITARHLLIHVSSLRDGTAYSRQYACGDPKMSLAVWMREYFSPGGAFYDTAENFHAWAPGTRFEYCNTSYGLLGLLVESISGIAFDEFCRRQIFRRLGMDQTDWFLSRVDLAKHVVPYTWFDGGEARGPAWGGLPLGVIADDAAAAEAMVAGGFRANCAYNHANFPDGFLRTSVRQLASYAAAYLNGGLFRGQRILSRATVAEMLTPQRIENGRIQGLTWVASTEHAGERAWGHSGSDPGVNTHLALLPARGVAAIAFTNTNGIRPTEIADRLLAEALGR